MVAAARPPRVCAAPTAVAPALLRYLRARGVDPAPLALRAGIAPEAEPAPTADATPDALDALIALAADALGEPLLALRLPGELPFAQYRFGELLARASATVGDGLAVLAQHIGAVVPGLEGTAGLEPRAAGEPWFALRLRSPGRPRGLGPRVEQYALASLLAYAREASGGAPPPVHAAWFAHARPRELGALYRALGTRELAFGAADTGFALDPACAARPAPGDDARLRATVAALAEAERAALPGTRSLAARVAACIESRLPDADIDAVARALRLSPRTLQRRLGAEQTRFSEVLDAVREARARALVVDDRCTLAEIAARLGFADVATFGRAFKRWTGRSPGAFRRG